MLAAREHFSPEFWVRQKKGPFVAVVLIIYQSVAGEKKYTNVSQRVNKIYQYGNFALYIINPIFITIIIIKEEKGETF